MSKKEKIYVAIALCFVLTFANTMETLASGESGFFTNESGLIVSIATPVDSYSSGYLQMLGFAYRDRSFPEKVRKQVDLISQDNYIIYDEIYNLPEPYRVYVKAETQGNKTIITFSGKSGIGTEDESYYERVTTYDFVLDKDLNVGGLYSE